MSGYRLLRHLAILTVIVGASLLLTGCQGLSGSNGTSPGNVGLTSSNLNFGMVPVGTSPTISDTISNNTSSAVTISTVTGVGYGFQVTGLKLPVTLAAGQSASFTVQFQPSGPGNPSVTISLNDPNAQTIVSLTAQGDAVVAGVLSLNPAQIAFGNVAVGSSQSSNVTLSNTGGSDLSLTQATLSGAGYTLGNLSLPLTLHAGDTASATVTFAPPNSGSFPGSVTFSTTSDQVNNQVVLNLTGTGTIVAQGTLSPNPSSFTFGNVLIGANSSKSETLTNTGGSSVTISQATASGAGFSISGLSLPVTLAVNQSVTFNAIFAPTSAGAVTGSISVTSNASNSPLSIGLSGTGVAPGALTANPSSLAFGNVQVGNTKNLSETLTNTGGSTVTISQATASGSGFSISGLSLPVTLAANQSVTFTATFTPAASGAVTGSISVVSNAPNSPLGIGLSGTGVTPGALTANPTSLAFGSVQVGNTKNLSETVTNTGGSTVTISQANVSGAGFSISGLSLPLSLNANQSVTFTATFAPAASGAVTGSVSVVSDASNSPLGIGLSGTGTAAGQLTVSPTSLAFGNVVVGSSSPLTGTLTASGASVTISSSTLNNSEFVLSGISLPVTLAANQSTGFTVTFTPQATGATSASLSFTSNAANSPTVQSMTGTGTAAPQHSVSLTWNASTNAVGYNIYRSTVNGGPYTEINGSLDGTTSYTDSTVTAGTTYYYVATAVDSGSNESGYSNQVTAVVPSP